MAIMVNVRFIKKGHPYGLSYIVGEFGVVSSLQATELEKLGVVEVVKNHSDIPEDCPGREILIENGITLLDDIRTIPDLTEIKGIGKALNTKIHDFVGNL